MLTGALRGLRIGTSIFVDRRAATWSSLPLADTRLQPVRGPEDLPGILGGEPPCVVLFHTLAPERVVRELRAQGHLALAFAHMPLYGRDPRPLTPFDLVVAGSRHVIASLDAAGIRRVYRQPL